MRSAIFLFYFQLAYSPCFTRVLKNRFIAADILPACSVPSVATMRYDLAGLFCGLAFVQLRFLSRECFRRVWIWVVGRRELDVHIVSQTKDNLKIER